MLKEIQSRQSIRVKNGTPVHRVETLSPEAKLMLTISSLLLGAILFAAGMGILRIFFAIVQTFKSSV